MGASFRLLDSRDAAWDALIARMPHDAYHLRGYAHACETHERGTLALALVERGRDALAVPVIVRDLPESLPGAAGLRDVSAPYGYPSIVCTSSPPAVQQELLGELLRGLAESGFVSAFLRCNPFVGLDEAALRGSADVVTHGDLVVVDLPSLPLETTGGFRPDHRRGIRVLREAGFTTRIDDKSHVELFPGLYRERMLAVGADPYYLFPDAYFQTLASELGEHIRLVSVVDGSGRLAAAALVLVCGEFAHYHLSATQEAFLRAAPMKLAVLGMIELCRDAGVARLNLGSGLGGRADSLFEFKAGFSTVRAPFQSARIVLDAKRYRELAGESDAAGFFPAYRRGY